MIKQFLGMLIGAGLLAGCTVDASSDQGSDGSEDVGTQAQAAVLSDWGGGSFAPHVVGMAINVHGVMFEWTDLNLGNGQFLGCFGGINPCAGTGFRYVSAFAPSQIRGIGVSQINGMVYAWASTPGVNGGGSFSKGTKDNLGPAQPFIPPGGLTMDQLIEVDQSASGTWQYFWQIGSSVRRSLSTSPGNGGTFTFGDVKVLSLPIVGIAIDQGSPNTVWTFYGSNGIGTPLDFSTNAQDLAD